MNDLEKVIRCLITTLKNEKDEAQRQRLIYIIKELKKAQQSLVDIGYLRAGYY